jgi:hypothetical protein
MMARRMHTRSIRTMKNYSLILFTLLSWSFCWTKRVHAAAEADTPTTETQTCESGSSSAGNNGACSAVDAPGGQKVSGAGGGKKYPECGLYLAESTIPNAGLGIFTAIAKKPNDVLGSGDVCIPNIDINYHNPPNVFDPFEAYYWSGFIMGMSRESHSNDVQAYCPGHGSVMNCNLALLNTHQGHPLLYDYAGLHRSNDPGAGAFTPYHNGTTYAARDIPAGGELFKFYGDEWFISRSHMFDGNFPIKESYKLAEEILRNMTAMKLDPEIQKDLYENVVVGMKEAFTSRVLGALPLTHEDAIIGAEQELAVLHQPSATRDLEWLRENGRCIDNIEVGYSSIRQAARGAFATRPLEADQVITTSPLHHLPLSSFVEKYNYEMVVNANGEMIRNAVSGKGYQVLVNYCYGHQHSSMLLCPYGNGINYINHNHTQANVKIRWAEDFDLVHNKTMIEEGLVYDLLYNYKPQLAFDYIATRDIQEGEELFLDYGDSFEASWQKHVANYKTMSANDYIDGMTINIHYSTVPIRTAQEQASNPYPEHLQIRAHGLLQNFPDLKDGMFTWTINDYGLSARVIERFMTATEHYYTVEVGILDNDVWNDKLTRDREAGVTWVRREKVPRNAVVFYDKPGYADMYMPNAFRQLIGIPDGIFPEQWKNGVGAPKNRPKPESLEHDDDAAGADDGGKEE